MLQGGEIIIILLLALVLLGPARLPEMAQKLGRWTAELRSAARDIRRGLESEVEELKQIGDDLRLTGEEIRKPIAEIQREFDEAMSEGPNPNWTGPKPVSGPTPEDAMADLRRIESEARQEQSSGPAAETDADQKGDTEDEDEA